jgi:hypothetical protein
VWFADVASNDEVQLVAWCQGTLDDGVGDPHVAILNEAGTISWRGELANPDGHCVDLAVAWNGEAFLVLWSTRESIYGAILAADGELIDAPFVILDGAVYWLDIDRWDEAEVRLVWGSFDDGHVRIRALADDLSTIWSDREVAHCNMWYPARVAVHRSSSALVCSEVVGGTSTNVWVQVYDNTGRGRESVRVAHQDPGRTVLPAGIAAFDDRFIASWFIREDDVMYTQRIDRTTGGIVGAPVRLIDAAGAPFTDLHIASMARANERGGASGFVASILGTDGGGNYRVYALRGDMDGRAVGGAASLMFVRGELGYTTSVLFQSDAGLGAAVGVWDRLETDPQILLSTLETCF